MRFSQFMEGWLYGEGGYYSQFREIGKGGDFYTAVTASKLFGGSIARYIYRLIGEGLLSPQTSIVEIGAHRGYLLADIVQFLYTFDPSLIESLSFAIVEPFPALQREQRDYFSTSFGDAVELRHYSSLDEVALEEGFVVANELFDAFPCELVYKGKMGYVEDFQITFGPMDRRIGALADRFGIEKGEVALGYGEFASKLWRAFKRVRFLTFDYGDLVARNDFSIRIYSRHQVYPLFQEGLDLKSLYGRSDMTYDLNFTHLIEAFEKEGFRKVAYRTQLAALVEFGITDLLQEIERRAGFDLYREEVGRAKILLHPSLMGERFKMVEFLKD
ncbi:MAG: hypothetical protein GXO19_06375 [Epsilonproteobacteria bacterium]|nr:hypothetical protein [Campylobacterota bacterium]NPA57342.1 hypothetical protein [Campylobacterota bacterium]